MIRITLIISVGFDQLCGRSTSSGILKSTLTLYDFEGNTSREGRKMNISVAFFSCAGKVAILLASEDPSLINAAVLFHPSFVNHDDVHGRF